MPLEPATERIYLKLVRKELSDVLMPVGGLFPNFRKLNPPSSDSAAEITIGMSQLAYDLLSNAAARHQESLPEYCLQQLITFLAYERPI